MQHQGPYWPSAEELAETGNTTLTSPITPDGTPEPGKRYTIPARQGIAVRVAAGQSIKIINTHGTQVVDTWAFCAADLTEHMSMEHLRTAIGGIFPKPGNALVTNKRRPIMQFTEDTTLGVHDTLMSACDIWRYRDFGITGYHDNCTDNLRMAMKAIGLGAPEVPAPFNLFMNIPVSGTGEIGWLPPTSPPGSYVVFRAEIDSIVVMSACPQDQIPVNGTEGIIVDAHIEVH
ncbi:MAG: urea carboxylase-associated family protein [Pseudomonadota bacterium]